MEEKDVKQNRKTKKLFSELKPRITLFALAKAKYDGFEVRKHSPFGLPVEEVGSVYLIEGYAFYIDNSLPIDTERVLHLSKKKLEQWWMEEKE